jgi:hypothetical protein
MNASDISTENLALTSWVWLDPSDHSIAAPIASTTVPTSPQPAFDLWQPIRKWLDHIELQNPGFAHLICKFIPAQCPFERDIQVFGRTLCHIPPLCKLNPVYDQVVALRFRALCYLADVCGEDITPYC